MAFRISPNFPGLERINTWVQSQFDQFKREEVDRLFNGRRFPNFHLLDGTIKVLRPVERFATFLIVSKENSTTYGLFAYSYDGAFFVQIHSGSSITTVAPTTNKTYINFGTDTIEVHNNEGAGRTYHVTFI